MGLEELVDKGYLRFVPIDPFTGADDTWITARDSDHRVANVRSGSDLRAQDGAWYRDW